MHLFPEHFWPDLIHVCDEYHYLFTCDFFKSNRNLYLKPYFYVKPNIRKYRELFTSTNEATLMKFIAIIMEKFSVWIVFSK